MANSDIVMCNYRYRGNQATDKFVCNDMFANQRSMPIVDNNNNVDDAGTFNTFYNSANRATLSVAFEKPL